MQRTWFNIILVILGIVISEILLICTVIISMILGIIQYIIIYLQKFFNTIVEDISYLEQKLRFKPKNSGVS